MILLLYPLVSHDATEWRAATHSFKSNKPLAVHIIIYVYTIQNNIIMVKTTVYNWE